MTSQTPSRTEPTPPGRRVRTLVWRWMDEPGSEHCALWESPDGWVLSGTVVFTDAGAPLLARYSVTCDAHWATREARIVLDRGGSAESLVLQADAGRRWWRNGQEVPEVRGCLDVDIAFTPATNTLAIRRLSLEVGEARDVTVAWVRMPDLAFLPSTQRYTRLAPSRYHFESLGSSFVADIDVDELGLVTHYPPGWERVASSSG